MEKNNLLAQMKTALLAVETIPEACWREIAALTEVKAYSKHHYFAEAGDRPTALAFVCQGTFRAFYRNAEGNEYNKTFFTDNTFMIALTSIVTGEANRINIQALEDAVVLQLDYRKFTRLFDTYPLLERLTRKVIEHEWVKKEVREIRLVLNDATERYQFFLQEHPGLENRIPQYHIASYLGVTPIQLSRIRAKLAGK